MDENCRTEIIELHQFFEKWFTAHVAQTQETFSRLRHVLADEFEIISPNGHRTKRTELLTGLWEAHDSQSDSSFGIRIENVGCQNIASDVCLVTYEEWQTHNGEVKGRLSTAVFHRRVGTPNGVEWLHLHEVWIS